MIQQAFDEATNPEASEDDLVVMNTAYTVRLNRGEASDNAIAAINFAYQPGCSVQNLI